MCYRSGSVAYRGLDQLDDTNDWKLAGWLISESDELGGVAGGYGGPLLGWRHVKILELQNQVLGYSVAMQSLSGTAGLIDVKTTSIRRDSIVTEVCHYSDAQWAFKGLLH